MVVGGTLGFWDAWDAVPSVAAGAAGETSCNAGDAGNVRKGKAFDTEVVLASLASDLLVGVSNASRGRNVVACLTLCS